MRFFLNTNFIIERNACIKINEYIKDNIGNVENLGLIYDKDKIRFSVEYQYASPWLYTNMNPSAYYKNYNTRIFMCLSSNRTPRLWHYRYTLYPK